MAKTDWRTGIRSLGAAEKPKSDWRTGIQALGRSDKTETITPEPVGVWPGYDPNNWADRKILEYRQMETQASGEDFERQQAQTRRMALERKLNIQKMAKDMSSQRKLERPFGPIGPSGSQESLPKEAQRIYDTKSMIGESVTPETRREALRTLMGYAGGLNAKHPMMLAGLGGAAGESLYQIGQHAVGSEKRPQTSGEAFKRIGAAGGIEFGEEGLSRALMKVVSPGADIPKARRETVGWMRERGIEPTLAQATESVGGYGILEGIAEGSFFSGKGMRVHKANLERQLKLYGDDIVKRFGGMSDIEAGRALQEIILRKKAARQAITKPMYEEVARMSKGHLISTDPLKRKFAKALKDISIEGVSKEATSIMPSLENKPLVSMLREGMMLPDEVPFEVINKIRQRIGQVAFAHPMEKTGQLFTKETDRVLADVYFSIGKIYQDPALGLPSDAAKMLKRADYITSDTHEIWDKKLIQRIVKEHPEKAINAVLQKGATTNVDEVIAATRLFETLDSEGKDVLKGAFVKDLITKQAIDSNGQLSGKKLLTVLGEKGMGQEVIEKFMSKEEIEELKFFGDALRVYANKPANLGGSFAIKLMQVSAAVGALGLLVPGVPGGKQEVGFTEGVIILGPKSVGWLFRQPWAVKTLSNALISEGGPKEVTRILTRLLTNQELKKLMDEDKKDMENQRRQTLEEAAMKYQYLPL